MTATTDLYGMGRGTAGAFIFLALAWSYSGRAWRSKGQLADMRQYDHWRDQADHWRDQAAATRDHRSAAAVMVAQDRGMNDARRLEVARVDLGSLSALGINRQFDECGRVAVPFRKRPRSRDAD
jgi:hypothetical protein